MSADPFRHHPELRGKITPADHSFFRTMDLDAIDRQVREAGHPEDWRTPCAEREANRRAFLAGKTDRDLWIFGYGSLMWDPSVEFTDVRRARTQRYRRSFCLWDDGGRGSIEQPGMMLAMDEGGVCEGLAFRIEAAKLDEETFVLFRREMLIDAYKPVWIDLETRHGLITALGFAADHASDAIRPQVGIDEQARMIATAQGLLGSSFDYLTSMVEHLQLLAIEDAYVSELFARTVTLRAGGTH